MLSRRLSVHLDLLPMVSSMQLRVFFIPYYATSHIIPMFQLAKLMSIRHGVEATMFLTPANAALIHRPSDDSVLIRIYPFPSSDVDLPPGHENFSDISSPSESWKLDKAAELARESLDPIIRRDKPDVVVVDYHYWWVIHTAHDLDILGVSFVPTGLFPDMVQYSLLQHSGDGDEAEGNDPFVVPDLPGPPIKMVKSELPLFLRRSCSTGDNKSSGILDKYRGTIDKISGAQSLRFGLVANTFYELEPDYCDHFRKIQRGRAWFVGPVALALGGESGGGDHRCMKWLDARVAGSVVYLCFGSWCNFTEQQLREMAVGLEVSGQAFLWVVRGEDKGVWMPEGWEERVEGRGLVVRGWAPQTAILGHPAVGAFVTHCGWNSMLEATAAGVPMLTWPLVVDQFIAERLVVEVMGVGVRMWEGYRSVVEEEKVVVPGEAIGKAVSEFMEAGGAGEEARRRAREYAAMTKTAVGEGGSSHRDLHRMVDELMEAAKKGKSTA